MEQGDEIIKDLKKENEKYSNRVFFFGFEVIAYFAVPAVLGVLLGKYLERVHDISITIPILFGTYILSWIIFIVRYRSLRKKRTQK